MIIDSKRIVRSFIYTIILGAVASAIMTLFSQGLYLGMSHGIALIVVQLAGGLCALADLYIWWWCFFGPVKDPFNVGGRGGNDGWNTGHGHGWTPGPTVLPPTGTQETETYKPEPVKPETIAMDRIVKVAFTYSDGKTECTLSLDPRDIRAKGGYSLGSSRSCDYPINDRTIAPLHARLYAAGEILCIQNLGNNNGVRVNGKELEYEESAPFPRRGTVYLGGARLDFRG